MELKTYPDRELMFLSLADQIAAQLGDFLRRTGAASLCVPTSANTAAGTSTTTYAN